MPYLIFGEDLFVIIALALGGTAYGLILASHLLRDKIEKEFSKQLSGQATVAIKNVKASIGEIVEKAISGQMDLTYREVSERVTKIEGGLADRISFMIHSTISELPEMKNVLLLPNVSFQLPASVDQAVKDLQTLNTTIEIVKNDQEEIVAALNQLTKHSTTLKDYIALKISSNEAEARERFATMNTPPPAPQVPTERVQGPTPGDLMIRPIAVAKIDGLGIQPGIKPLAPIAQEPKPSKARRVFNVIKP